ncbi:SusC/RagA family TonB-linked outer membrane protein [Ferruginibacter yonginensis]|uniref:SusC/RagA family TonB-linked outer membrane protein n=1 Tax=Ferruginibacter yonginensis TaxID=1310416 RepID=A0ABV8QQU1_9BACT
MKQIRGLLIMLPLLLVAGFSFAQKNTVTGKVTDKNTGEALSGVNVLTTNKKGGVVTNKDGVYSITLKSANETLVFSYVGYITQTITTNGKSTFDIALSPSNKANDEVVVIGYGTQKKSSVTGAVSKYKNERLDESPASRLDQALQGKIAGVQIQNISSDAGAAPKVRVRGISSINAGADPLVVVDGHPVPDGLAFVNMADVESVEVLKDAASAAIYGSRAASGVILITTKSGKADKTRYSVKISTGIKQPYKLYKVMTTSEYTNLLFYEAALRAQDPTAPPPTTLNVASTAERAAYVIENTIMGGQATDWQTSTIRDANTKNIQLAASGGTKNLKYFLGAGYQNDQGFSYHSEYERFNVRAKLDAQLGKKVKVSFNFNPSYIKRERPSVSYIDFVRFPSYLPIYLNESTAAFVRQNPLYPDVKAGDFAQARFFNGRVYSGLMPDGSIWNTTTAADPFNTANNTPKSVLETRSITSNDYRATTSFDMTINLAKGLDFKTLLSSYINISDGLDFAKRNSNRAGDVNRGVFTNRTYVDLLNENTVTYTKQIKDHSITALAGFTAQVTKSKNDQTVGLDFPSDNIQTLNTALLIEKENTFSLKNKEGLLSVLSRVNYDFKSKYIVSASIRGDGSSKFATGKKWGYFPSVSVGWVATKENFLSDVKWLNNLKLRASYGATGNNRINDFLFIDLLYQSNYPIGGGNGTSGIGQVPSRDVLSNPDITWETTYQYNGGLDLGLFKNSLNITVDVYQSRTDKLLLNQNVVAFAGAPTYINNIGSLQNRGIEVEVTNVNVRTKNFKWTTSGNISRTRNKILALGGESFFLNQGERTEVYLNKVGSPLIQFFGYKTDGVWLSQAQINEAQAKGLTSSLSNVFTPGGLKLVDINGDNKIDANDRTVIGNPYPDFTWGVTNSFTLKNFDVSFSFQGVHGGSLVNGDANYNEIKRYNRNYNQNRWISAANPGDGKTPYSTTGFANWLLTDYAIEDASYYCLRDVLVGYTLPQSFANRAKLSSMRLYFSAQNLFFHFADNYRGINPEGRLTTGPYASPLADGYQRGSYPMSKTFLLGVDINF